MAKSKLHSLPNWFTEVLTRKFNLKPVEIQLITPLFAHHFFQGFGFAILFTVGIATFLEIFTVESLPFVYVVSAGILLIVGRVYAYLEFKLPVRKILLFVNLLLIAISVLSQAGLYTLSSPILFFLLLVNYRLFYLIGDFKFWTLSGLLSEIRQNRKLFGMINLGDIPGKLIGFSIFFLLVPLVDLKHLFVFSIIAFTVSNFVFYKLLNLNQVKEQAERESDEQFVLPPLSFLKSFFKVKYILLLSLLSFWVIVTATLIDYLFLSFLSSQLENQDEIALYLSIFFGFGYAGIFVVKLIYPVTPLRQMSVKRSLLILPVTLLVIISVFLFFDKFTTNPVLFWFSGALFILILVFRYTLHDPVFFTLFQHLSYDIRRYWHTAIKGIVEPLGLCFSAVLIWTFFNYDLPHVFNWLVYALLVTTLFWITAILVTKRIYLQVLKNAAELHSLNNEDAGIQEQEIIDLLVAKLQSERAEEVIYAIEELSRMEVKNLSELLLLCLQHQSTKVKIHALEKISFFQLQGLENEVLALVDANHPDRLREKAIQTYLLLGEEALQPISDWLEKEDDYLQKGLIVGLLKLEKNTLANLQIEKMIHSGDFAKHILVLEIIAEMELANQKETILRFLKSKDNTLKTKAIWACAYIPDPSFVSILISFLKDEKFIIEASNALAIHGALAFESLAQSFHEAWGEKHNYLLLLCKVLGKIKDEASHFFLWELTRYPWVILQIEAHQALQQSEYYADNRMQQNQVLDAIKSNFEQVYWTLEARLLIENNEHYQLLNDALKLELSIIYRKLNFLFCFLDPLLKIPKSYSSNYNNIRIVEEAVELLPNPLSTQLKVFVGDYGNDEMIEQLSSFYSTRLFDEISVISNILQSQDREERFNRWTQAAALYSLTELASPSLLRRSLLYLESQDALLRETSFYRLKEFAENHGESLLHYLKLVFESDQISQIMAMFNDSKKLLDIEKVIILKGTRMFSETPENVLAEIAETIEEQWIPKGESIFRKGEIGNCMYIIYEGEIKIHDDKITFNTLINRDFFGELGLLDSNPRSASATAERDSLLLRLDQDKFYELMANRTEVAKGIMQVLCFTIRTQNRLITELQSVRT